MYKISHVTEGRLLLCFKLKINTFICLKHKIKFCKYLFFLFSKELDTHFEVRNREINEQIGTVRPRTQEPHDF